jgi:hypothetical protein
VKKCYGVPKPNQMAGAHPMVSMDHVLTEAGIEAWQCPVCKRFLLVWEEDDH